MRPAGYIFDFGLPHLSAAVHATVSPDMFVLRKDMLYILTLACNILFRTVIYSLASGSGDEKHASQESYTIMVNTVSVLLLSIYHSRNIKSGYLVTKVY